MWTAHLASLGVSEIVSLAAGPATHRMQTAPVRGTGALPTSNRNPEVALSPLGTVLAVRQSTLNEAQGEP